MQQLSDKVNIKKLFSYKTKVYPYSYELRFEAIRYSEALADNKKKMGKKNHLIRITPPRFLKHHNMISGIVGSHVQ